MGNRSSFRAECEPLFNATLIEPVAPVIEPAGKWIALDRIRMSYYLIREDSRDLFHRVPHKVNFTTEGNTITGKCEPRETIRSLRECIHLAAMTKDHRVFLIDRDAAAFYRLPLARIGIFFDLDDWVSVLELRAFYDQQDPRDQRVAIAFDQSPRLANFSTYIDAAGELRVNRYLVTVSTSRTLREYITVQDLDDRCKIQCSSIEQREKLAMLLTTVSQPERVASIQ